MPSVSSRLTNAVRSWITESSNNSEIMGVGHERCLGPLRAFLGTPIRTHARRLYAEDRQTATKCPVLAHGASATILAGADDRNPDGGARSHAAPSQQSIGPAINHRGATSFRSST